MSPRCYVFKALFFMSLFMIVSSADEFFEQDIGNDMKIGLSDTGYKSVKLQCGSNSMHVHLVTDEDFLGVIYTRGSFHDKLSPCFLDPGNERGQRSFSMRFNLDKCKTMQKGGVYSNVLVLQHDKDLIMPGDAAFNLECDFRKPRDVTVQANLNKEKLMVTSRISLEDADPSERTKRQTQHAVENASNIVEFTPKHITLQKMKLGA